ncbi:MAG: hypothetical protein KDJ43_00545 [Rhizobiaceae bacterium]|nr:hypothetical protein [Rhizobiaceae bacterium]
MTDPRYVPALTGEILPAEDSHALTAPDAAAIAGGQQLANLALSGRAGSRAQQSDTAVSHAHAHLIASAPVVGGLVVTSSGLVLLGWLIAGGPLVLWIALQLAVVGAGAVVALTRSRRAGLEHTPAGVERHEIDARVKVAMYAIDRSCEMVERIRGVRE